MIITYVISKGPFLYEHTSRELTYSFCGGHLFEDDFPSILFPTWDMLEGTTCPSGKNLLYRLHRGGGGGGWKFWEPLGSFVVRIRELEGVWSEKNDETYFLAVFETGGPDANVAQKHVAMSRVGLKTCLFKNLWAFVFKWWFPIFSFMFVQLFFFSELLLESKAIALRPGFARRYCPCRALERRSCWQPSIALTCAVKVRNCMGVRVGKTAMRIQQPGDSSRDLLNP